MQLHTKNPSMPLDLTQPPQGGSSLDRLQEAARLGEPLDIADGFVYLASDEARYLTGTALVLDGGLTSGIWSGGESGGG